MKKFLFLSLACLLTTSLDHSRVKAQEGSSRPNSDSQAHSKPDVIDGEVVYVARDVSERAVMLQKLKSPHYTEGARKKGIEGTVILRAVLQAKGRVTHVEVKQGLPEGLTEECIAAAKRIKFKPAKKDGKSVSQWATIMYDFHL